jgi:DNA polymerase-3 subunit gamma/tau
MLTQQAFNALLKTLEEPPAHVIFILATTDPQKIIPTVLSRCQRYNFSKITLYEIQKRMIEVLDRENIPYDEKAVSEVARMAEGGMRDALSILEQCLAYNPEKLSLEDVEHIFGLTSTEEEVDLYLKIHQNKVSEVIEKLRNMYAQGMDTKRLAVDMLEIVKDTLIYSDKAKEKLLNRITAAEAQEIINNISMDTMLKDADNLEILISREKMNQSFLVYMELCLIKMAETSNTTRPITKEKEHKETKAESPVESVDDKEETVQSYIVEPETEFLLSILLDANKDLKIADQIIYNKLDLYRYEPEKRKFYQLLIGTELFASNKDAIIICGNKSQSDNINTKATNEELYKFINNEFGIDKMVYGIDNDKKRELIEQYKRTPAEMRNRPVYVEKYHFEETREKKPEDKLKDLFGDVVKVED